MRLLKYLLPLSILLTTPSRATIDNLVKNETTFAFSLYDKLTTQNVLFSPYSIANCLEMTYLGARNQTASEMQKVLSLTVSNMELPQYVGLLNKEITGAGINLANAMWVSPKVFILTDYRHLIEKNFQAQLSTVDFDDPEKALKTINSWVADKTDDKITDLLQPEDIDRNTRLVLTNAVYYQGAWLHPFSLKNTKREVFHISNSKSEEVDMMEQTALLDYCKDEGFESVALPFRDTTVVCLLMLPKEGVINPENALSRALENQKRTRVELKVPRFEIKQRLLLSELLQTLGMKQAFTPQADFSGIDGLHDLFLSTVVHEAFLSLNEDGVVAAASSAASIGLTGALDKDPPVSLTFDHPFLFWIIDMNTKAVLFMGRYTCSSCPGS